MCLSLGPKNVTKKIYKLVVIKEYNSAFDAINAMVYTDTLNDFPS